MTCNYPELGSASDWILIDITNQKHYPDLVSDASLVWNHYFCARFSDVISRETSDDVAKSRLFSEVKHIHIEQRILPCGQILVCIPHQ